MTKKEFDLLEKVYAREVESALRGYPSEFQTKSKVAKKLESDGFLAKTESTIIGNLPVIVMGYTLTHLGRMSYCMECAK
jgi:hypothetical protein